MTKEEIIETRPGKKLDAMVGEAFPFISHRWRRYSDGGKPRCQSWSIEEYCDRKSCLLACKGERHHADGCWDAAEFPAPQENFSKDWDDANQLKEFIGRSLFSKRRTFLYWLGWCVRFGQQKLVTWPDIFLLVTPEHICKAALITDLVWQEEQVDVLLMEERAA